MISRRHILSGTAAGLGALATPSFLAAAAARPLIDDVAERTFRFFWDTTNPRNGLVPDRYPTPSPASIAAVGFALTAYPIGVERGWIDRAAARERTLTTLRFFWSAPQGPAPEGMSGYKGFFYHFLDMETGARRWQCELSTIDTALLLAGMLFAAGYFDRDDRQESEIRSLADRIYARVDWTWFAPNAPLLSMGWHPERGFIPADWRGYNEGMLLYVLALGSPAHPLQASAWDGWTAGYSDQWLTRYGIRLLGFSPLFGHQYSHVWIDFRGIRDAAMRQAGWDYFENSRRAALVQRAYATANPMGWADYGSDIWGLTACDGPGGARMRYRGEIREFRSYSARGYGGVEDIDDGTLAPTAALGSIAFTPAESIAAAEAMHARYGARLYGRYGFRDAFNPSFRFEAGDHPERVDTALGWVDSDWLGIDQGPIVAMIENRRSDLVWRTMRKSKPIRTGLQRAGFTGGWLAAPS